MGAGGIWEVLNAGGAAVAAACALYVTLRDRNLLKRTDARTLNARIDAAQKAADNWHDTEPARVLKAQVDRHGDQLIKHDGELGNVATKTDAGRIDGKVTALAEKVKHAADGIDRIEGLLIKRALSTEERR